MIVFFLVTLWISRCFGLNLHRGVPISHLKRTTICTFTRYRKKPAWVVREVVRIKAHSPKLGCRKIAETFNRLHAPEMTVSKSYVYQQLIRHQAEIRAVRSSIRRRRLSAGKVNRTWGVDLTQILVDGGPTSVLGVVDHGSRACLALMPTPNKSSLTLLRLLIIARWKHGKPNTIRTDNEAVFVSRLFRLGLRALSVRHQTTDVACPWMNGRVERFFGTFKPHAKRMVFNTANVNRALEQFRWWYNTLRPHSSLDGKTPAEVWNEQSKTIYRIELWDRELTGYCRPPG